MPRVLSRPRLAKAAAPLLTSLQTDQTPSLPLLSADDDVIEEDERVWVVSVGTFRKRMLRVLKRQPKFRVRGKVFHAKVQQQYAYVKKQDLYCPTCKYRNTHRCRMCYGEGHPSLWKPKPQCFLNKNYGCRAVWEQSIDQVLMCVALRDRFRCCDCGYKGMVGDPRCVHPMLKRHFALTLVKVKPGYDWHPANCQLRCWVCVRARQKWKNAGLVMKQAGVKGREWHEYCRDAGVVW